MLKFVAEGYERKNIIPKNCPEMLDYEIPFKILVDGKLFFEEPNFPIYEFLHALSVWIKKEDCSFEYISVETEDNPLISFIYSNDSWTISSTWQLFECEMAFTKEEILHATKHLIKC